MHSRSGRKHQAMFILRPKGRARSCMKQHEQTRMLLRKAAADESLLDRVLSEETVDDEIIGFHCQQAVEKLLKAWLSSLGVNYPKTHNLQTLIELLEQQGKIFPQELS